MENQPKINVQTNGNLESDLQPIKKVKLHEHLSEAEINALIEKKRSELRAEKDGKKP